MDPVFWHERWRQNQIGFHQPAVNEHLQRFYPALQLAAGAGVFVPLAGKSLDLLWLRDRGHPVVAVELSPLAVQAFFRENGLSPVSSRAGAFEVCEVERLRFLCGDFFDLSPAALAGVQAVYDRAALIALPPPLRRRYVAHLAQLLPPAASVLLVTLEYPADAMQGPPFSVEEAEVRSLYGDRFDMRVLASVDRLALEPRWREKGVQRLDEKVYLLRPRDI